MSELLKAEEEAQCAQLLTHIQFHTNFRNFIPKLHSSMLKKNARSFKSFLLSQMH